MQRNPHQLIEGIAIAALAADATHAFIFIRGEYDLQGDILDQAVAEAYEAGYLGKDILGSHRDLELVVHRGAGAYICGEETALLDALEGKRGNPRLKPPFPAVQGLYGGPTLINNVETLSNVPRIVAHGAEWFKGFGTEQSPGTKVVSVSGCVQRPGNYEVELGIPTRELIYDLAGGPAEGREVKAIYPGGSSSPVLKAEECLDLPYSFEAMADAGSMLGSGSIIVADDTVSIPLMALRTARFYHHESCGKCTPCREGTNWTVKMLERMVRGEATPMDLDIVASVQENIIGHCLCVLGDSMAMPVGAMVRKFRDEFEEVDGRRGRMPHRRRAGSPRDAGGGDMMSEITLIIDGREVTANEGEMLHDAAQRGRRRDPGLLLRAEARRAGRRLPDVPGRDRGDPETADLLLDAGPRRDGRPHPHRPGQTRAERGGRVPPRQPPARLPGLRQRRRMPAAGHHDGLGPGQNPLHRRQAPLREAGRALAPGRDRPRALHPLLPLRPLQPGGRRGRAAAAARARRSQLRRHLRRPPLHRPLPRQHHRPLPGRGADQLHVPVPRPALGHRELGLGLHALPEPVQRQLHDPRRGGEAGRRPRQPRRRRRLALRPRPLRVRDVRRRGAGHRPPAAGRRRGRLGGGDRESGGRAEGRRRAAARRSSATPPTRRATSSSGSCARRSARRTSTRGSRAGSAATRSSASPTRGSRPGSATSTTPTSSSSSAPTRSTRSPILDLRIRKAIRRNGTRLAVATDRPTALDGGAEAVVRYKPVRGSGGFLADLAEALRRRRRNGAAADRRGPPRTPRTS